MGIGLGCEVNNKKKKMFSSSRQEQICQGTAILFFFFLCAGLLTFTLQFFFFVSKQCRKKRLSKKPGNFLQRQKRGFTKWGRVPPLRIKNVKRKKKVKFAQSANYSILPL